MQPINSTPGTPDGREAEAAALGRQFESLLEENIYSIDESERFIVVPKGRDIRSLKPLIDEFRTKPERRKGTATIGDTDSLIAHLRRFASGESAVFANPSKTQPSFTAVYDYHPATSDATTADWLGHRAVYAPALSDEWKVWAGANGREFGQDDFARFIEDHITDIVPPDLSGKIVEQFVTVVQGDLAQPGDILGLSRGLQVNVESTVKQATTLSSGEISVIYDEQHRDGAGAPIKVKNLFQIAVPVFYAGALYRLTARLRYRIRNGSLVWSYHLYRPELTFDDAFRGIVEKITSETDVPVFIGAPEQ